MYGEFAGATLDRVARTRRLSDSVWFWLAAADSVSVDVGFRVDQARRTAWSGGAASAVGPLCALAIRHVAKSQPTSGRDSTCGLGF